MNTWLRLAGSTVSGAVAGVAWAGDLQRPDPEGLLRPAGADLDRRRDRRRLRVAAGQGDGLAPARRGRGELDDPGRLVVLVGTAENVGVAAQERATPREHVDGHAPDHRRGVRDGEAPRGRPGRG